ncbi:MAG: CPBP family intramembrane metalloprotease [Clostridia bacterium]|nr:CPBP family intramembrane metalloprotease [Clostridia bacterium]
MKKEETTTYDKTAYDKVDGKRIVLYLLIVFVITYVLEIGVVGSLAASKDKTSNMLAQIVTASMMMIPALSVVITRLVTKEGFQYHNLNPNLKGNGKYYLFAWFAPAVMILLGAVLYFICIPGTFDYHMGYALSVYSEQNINITSEQLRTTIFSQMAAGIFMSPIINLITCFGEEWGWRGYLLPKLLKKFSFAPTVLISGLIWGLWHAPLTVLGHNYGLDYPGYPYLGIVAMCIFCIVMGTIFSYLCIKVKSCVPAIIMHGAVNGLSATAIYFTEDGGNPFIGPSTTGILGGSMFIICAVICLILVYQKKTTSHTN